MQRKRPLHGKIFARCIPKRLFAGLFGCMARISCQSQLISDAWRANLATKGRFSRPRPHFASIFPSASARERTVVKSCHGKALGNAPHEYIATASQAKNASGRNPATIGRWERISRAFCHRRAPGERISATSCQQNGIFVRAGLLPCHSSRTA